MDPFPLACYKTALVAASHIGLKLTRVSTGTGLSDCLNWALLRVFFLGVASVWYVYRHDLFIGPSLPLDSTALQDEETTLFCSTVYSKGKSDFPVSSLNVFIKVNYKLLLFKNQMEAFLTAGLLLENNRTRGSLEL